MAGRLLFGEFLVQKGLLDASTVLNVLIDQIRSQPSVAEIVHGQRLLSEEQQLEVLRVQSQTGWDYQQACVSLNIWSQTLAESVTEKSSKARMPLGQLIVTKGLMTLSELTRALDEFVGACESDGGSTRTSSKNPPSVPSLAVQPTETDSTQVNKVIPIGIAGSNYEPQFSSVDPVLLTEFIQILPPSRPEEVAQITGSWPSKIQQGDTDAVTMELKALSREMDSIRGAARFIRAELVERIMHLGTQMIENALNHPSALNSRINELADATATTYRIVWHIRDVLASERTERSVWLATDQRKSCEDVIYLLERSLSSAVA